MAYQWKINENWSEYVSVQFIPLNNWTEGSFSFLKSKKSLAKGHFYVKKDNMFSNWSFIDAKS